MLELCMTETDLGGSELLVAVHAEGMQPGQKLVHRETREAHVHADDGRPIDLHAANVVSSDIQN